MTAASAALPLGYRDAIALEQLAHGRAVLLALGLHRFPFLAHAVALGIGRGRGTDATLTRLEDGDAGPMVLKRQAADVREQFLTLGIGEAGALVLTALGLGLGGGPQPQHQGCGNQGALERSGAKHGERQGDAVDNAIVGGGSIRTVTAGAPDCDQM